MQHIITGRTDAKSITQQNIPIRVLPHFSNRPMPLRVTWKDYRPLSCVRRSERLTLGQQCSARCGLPNRVAESALSKLPKAEAKKVRTAMNSLGSLNLRDIDDAKEAVARASVGTSSREMRHAPLAA